MLTKEEFKSALPSNLGRTIPQEVMDKVNDLLADPDMRESYRENLVCYGSVLKEGRFKLTSYVDAITYVSHKLRNVTNIEAYKRTFPDKYQDFVARGVSAKDIASYVSAYHKSKLVTLILEQSIVPSWILNQDLFQKALNVQADLMMNAHSEKVRSDAAKNILENLKMPETAKVHLSINDETQNDALAQLRNATAELANQQKELLKTGSINLKDVSNQGIVIEHNAAKK